MRVRPERLHGRRVVGEDRDFGVRRIVVDRHDHLRSYGQSAPLHATHNSLGLQELCLCGLRIVQQSTPQRKHVIDQRESDNIIPKTRRCVLGRTVAAMKDTRGLQRKQLLM